MKLSIKILFLIICFFAFGYIFFTQAVQEISEKETPTLLFTGDIMLGRYVETLMNKYGQEYPLEKISDVLHSSTLVVTNLEGPINSNHKHTPDFTYKFSFHPKVAKTMREYGIDIAVLGNNHTDDFGQDSFTYTKQILKENTIESVGHPTAINNQSILKTHFSDTPISILSYNDTYGTFDVNKAIKQIESLNQEDFIIIQMHWGHEYKLTSNSHQEDLAHQLIDAGADLIIGHHPHVVQEIETYKGKYIFYSLGNFIFDQYFSKDVQEGLLVKLEFQNDAVSYHLLPISSYLSQPELMSRKEKRHFLEELSKRSSESLQNQIINGILYDRN